MSSLNYHISKIYQGLVLGEGCIWDEERGCVHFVDITRCKILTYYLETKHTREIVLSDYVGCIVLDQNNNLIAAVKDTLLRVDVDTGNTEFLLSIKLKDHMRFNDGKCDKYGNLWIGTMHVDVLNCEHHDCGKLYCIKNNEIISEYEKYSIPNGLAWRHSGALFYHVDSYEREITEYSVISETHIVKNRTLIKFSETDGFPDGMCMDTDENIWVAMWGASKVCCINSITGDKIAEIVLEDQNVSCCTFGGEDMRQLFITTAEDVNGKGGLYVVSFTEMNSKNFKGTIAYKYLDGIKKRCK